MHCALITILCLLLSSATLTTSLVRETFSYISFSQIINSTLSGVVKDDFGNLVATAKVAIKDEDQEILLSVMTNERGGYRFENIPFGNYKLTVEKDGLNSESVTDISLSTATEVVRDLTLQLTLDGKAVKKVQPVYPPAAKNTQQEGRVIVGVMVNPEGKVEKAIFLGGNPIFKTAALQAAQRWIFQKTNSGISGRIAFNFKLRSGENE